MVSESEFDKNQQAFRATQQAMQQTQGAGQPTEGGVLGAIQQAKASVGLPVNPLNAPPGTASSALEMTPGLGVAGGAKSALLQRGGGLLKQTIALAAGIVILQDILKTVGGKAGELGNNAISYISDFTGWDLTDADNKFSIIRKAYTTPFEDPVTGELRFLDPQGKELEKAARDAGQSPESESFQILKMQLDAEKQQNIELVIMYEQGLPEGWQRPGESPLAATQRYATALNKFQENAFLEDVKSQQPANAQGMTQAQIDQTNAQFQGAVVGNEVARQKKESTPNVLSGPEATAIPKLGFESRAIPKTTSTTSTPKTTTSSGFGKPTENPFTGGSSSAAGFSSAGLMTRAQLQERMQMSLTEEAWQFYRKTGRLP